METAIASSKVIAGSAGAASKFPSSGTTVVTASSVETAIALSKLITSSAGAVHSKFSETVSA